ncbi:Predicted lipid-binding transport protein, Tim44 family [Sphingomonas laterariae]|uniref:Predicted lipid-binding transport protein, Tim44 family n=1 Tax=Edaphosphingomonas laterariae TaxID=861865 RepID=A0A239ERD5_9SPHN|nr:Tim44/TimA family putative adaptor protein [Sphingomonas laterariae]SNS46472.1 Predicted lipid-binding transport protein, Tim44 family [Sphingomonas laterariae]
METIIILALVFVFVAMRLYSVLGRRTGHEQPIAKPVEAQPKPAPMARSSADIPSQPVAAEPAIDARANEGIRAIVAADPNFDVSAFLNGAQAAYRMVLEAFWRGDRDELARLVDDNVREDFVEAIRLREEAGEVLDNRLISVERAVIKRARLDGQMASVTVRFDADIAAVTRDKEGNVVAGSLSDAVPTHDVWTFSRHVRADDPNWILIETDEAA